MLADELGRIEGVFDAQAAGSITSDRAFPPLRPVAPIRGVAPQVTRESPALVTP
jgi:hypothetical protein